MTDAPNVNAKEPHMYRERKISKVAITATMSSMTLAALLASAPALATETAASDLPEAPAASATVVEQAVETPAVDEPAATDAVEETEGAEGAEGTETPEAPETPETTEAPATDETTQGEGATDAGTETGEGAPEGEPSEGTEAGANTGEDASTGASEGNGTSAAPTDPAEPSDPAESETGATDEKKDATEAGKTDEATEKKDADESAEDETAAAAASTAPVVAALLATDGSSVTFTAHGGQFDNAWGVAVAVTSSGRTFWVSAQQQADGSWVCVVDASTLGTGTVSGAFWANVGSSPAQSLGTAYTTVPAAGADLSIAHDSEKGAIVVTAKKVVCPTGVTFVSAGVTAPDGTVKWYKLEKATDGTWSVAIDPADFNWQSGMYKVTASICDGDWKGVSAGSASATVSFGNAVVEAGFTDDGTSVVFTAKGGQLERAWNVAFHVDSANGAFWVAGVKQSDGSWKAEVTNEKLGAGKAVAAAWANVGSAPAAAMGSASVVVPSNETRADLGLSYDATSGKIVARADNAYCTTGIEFISVGLTSPSGTTKWYRLSKESTGSWSVAIDPSDFSWQSGTYTLVGSICDSSWKGVSVGSTAATMSFGAETLTATLSSDGSVLTIAASGNRYAQAWGVAFEVAGAAKTSWVAGSKTAGGSWTVATTSSEFGGGVLTVTAYANIGTQTVRLGSTQVRTKTATPTVVTTVSSSTSTINAVAYGGAYDNAVNVAFEVYNVADGISTAKWFQAYKQADGSWAADIPAAQNGVGTCIVNGWATVGSTTSKYAENRYTFSVAPQLTTEIYLGGGDYEVSYGMAGLKVQRIQQALGIGVYNYPRYLEQTVASVTAFQQRVGLPATGVTDYATWIALGLDSNEWYTLGAYASPVTVSANATSAQRIEAMIARANEYLGDSYVWDAAGAPGQGVDCAGLVMQALYAAGCDTGIINPVTHSTTAWGDRDAANYYSYGGFTKVNVNERSRGDLVFYGSSSNVDHVAIYLGGDQIIEAYPNTVRINSLWYRSIAGLRRVFC